MSRRFWTADCHFGHANICKYCGRPFFKPERDLDSLGHWVSEEIKQDVAYRMNAALIRNMNARIKPGDEVVHVGDFCCKGNDRGVSGTRTKAEEWERQLNGKWIHVLGNHDDNNGVRHGFDMAVVSLGGYRAFVQHRPIERACEVPDFCNFVICGHVHEKWKAKKIDGIWNINVGVDARRFFPLDDGEVAGLYNKLIREETSNARS